ncbi:right-handed parallel beta-helix repeat-containing protein [Luteolibacter sp. SL250]|uniref:right-handed parallel beta-helix repeat-containing protein n=1 Tax=Luteolibacter sp. SL250 TaxID=2995170 RepID=UPI002271D7D3|nr:right-handed parallel beta-helix repeat-containing protein [Luteolibacter sp. SL250]WAC20890.1 right-handed parallel beta-helix repeat-containing protein [Luteolibacter sp. SL250]
MALGLLLCMAGQAFALTRHAFWSGQGLDGQPSGELTAASFHMRPSVERAGTSITNTGGATSFTDFQGMIWTGSGTNSTPGHCFAWNPGSVTNSMTLSFNMSGLTNLAVRMDVRSAGTGRTTAFEGIDYSIDGGATFAPAQVNLTLTGMPSTNSFFGYSLDLSSLAGIENQWSVKIRFRIPDQGSGSSLRLDNIQVSAGTSWSPTDPIGPQFTAEEKISQRAAGSAILSQIRSAASNGAGTFTIPPGDYRFSGASGSNPVMQNLHHLRIVGTGATFWWDSPQTYGWEFWGCSNIEIIGLTLDCDPQPHAQGRITALDRVAGTVDMTVMDGYQMPTLGSNRATIFYRPDGTFIKRGPINGKAAIISGRSIRVTTVNLADVNVGDYMVISQRTAQFLVFKSCSNMLVQDVNMWSFAGMAVTENGGQGGNVYRRLKATRRPGTNRLHCFGADGLHMTNTGIGPRIEDCEVAYTSDDLINIHGTFGQVAERVNSRTFRVLGSPYTVGTRLDFWDEYSLEHLGFASVIQSSRVTDPAQIAEARSGTVSDYSPAVYDVILDGDVDAGDLDLIEHRQNVCEGFVVKDSYFHSTFNRAFLVNGSPSGLITGNTFERVHSGGINMGMETWRYMEGQFPSGTVIENNRLVDMPGIQVELNARGVPRTHRHRPVNDITIRNNYVENTIKVMQVDRVNILNNTLSIRNIPVNWTRPVVSESEYGASFGDAIFLSVVANANVAGNKVMWNNPGGEDVRVGPLGKNIWIDGLQQLEPVADSNTGWWLEGVQGDQGWRYGSADGVSVRNGIYYASMFQQFATQSGGRWREGTIPNLGRYDLQPSDSRAVVRRWVSPSTASTRAKGRVQTFGGTGNRTKIYLFLGGILKWSHDITTAEVYEFDVNLGVVYESIPVDFVIDSKGDATGDDTQLSVTMLRAPTGGEMPSQSSGLAGIPATTFDAWRHEVFDSEQLSDPDVSGAFADTNRDGLVNLLEYFLGRDPVGQNAARTLPLLRLSDETVEFIYTRRKSAAREMTDTVQWSATLTEGSWTDAGVIEEILNDDGVFQIVRASLAKDSELRRFFRLKVE